MLSLKEKNNKTIRKVSKEQHTDKPSASMKEDHYYALVNFEMTQL